MIHLILQFTLRITFHCVLHRFENQDIHRQELFCLMSQDETPSHQPSQWETDEKRDNALRM